MEQCRQGKSAKWIRLDSGDPVPNPSTVGGLLEPLTWREWTTSCRLGDGLGTALSGAFPGRQTANSELVRTREIQLETTAKGMGLAESAEKEDPVELDYSPTLGNDLRVAEWPCSHDPLRFSPLSLRFDPPPFQSQALFCAYAEGGSPNGYVRLLGPTRSMVGLRSDGRTVSGEFYGNFSVKFSGGPFSP
ncbi:hypothetical protein YC2023_098718 [Brassica napus]